MDRYFFDIDNGHSSTTDDTGIVVGSSHNVAKITVRTLTEIARHAFVSGEDRRNMVVHVRDSDGEVKLVGELRLTLTWIENGQGTLDCAAQA